MPQNFWPSVHLYARLHRPYMLLEGCESFPLFEPLWRFFFNAADRRNDRLLVVSNHVPYPTQWTYMHFQVQRMDSNDGWRACGALNAVKATCVNLPDQQGSASLEQGLGWPEQFLQGIEFTTEMLVPPRPLLCPVAAQPRCWPLRRRGGVVVGCRSNRRLTVGDGR